jgi:hypothetical protein
MGEEKPTGKMRWLRPYRVIGDLFRETKLQQEWEVTPISGPSFTEWRNVSIVYEQEKPHDP